MNPCHSEGHMLVLPERIAIKDTAWRRVVSVAMRSFHTVSAASEG